MALEDSLFRAIIIGKIMNCDVGLPFHTQFCLFAYWFGFQRSTFPTFCHEIYDVFDSFICSSSHSTCTSLVWLGNNDEVCLTCYSSNPPHGF